MFRWLIILFTLVPIIELALLIQVGRWIGLLPTVGLVVATGITGAALAAREGTRAWHAFQRDVWEGRIPGRSILDGLAVFGGGALLLTPGLLTDILGFALLVRPTRRWLQDRLISGLKRGVIAGGQLHVRTWSRRRGSPDEGRGERPAAGREIGPDEARGGRGIDDAPTGEGSGR